MDYDFRKIEKKWQAYWAQNGTFKTKEDPSKPKFYVLDMFPYPSGAGLHVGHPLGYIASDIYSRYKRLKGFNVLHPMGYDAFGLPAEQYAIQTGQHPEVTTVNNINRYRQQMDRIGFSYDWSRELRTCDPAYYKWTQWAFLKMFGSWYDNDAHEGSSDRGFDSRVRERRKHCRKRRLHGARTVHGGAVAGIFRKREVGRADELPHRLSGRDGGELVRRTRNCARQRRGEGWPFSPRRLPCGAEEDEAVAAQGFGLCRKASRRSGQDRLDRLPQGDAAQLDRKVQRLRGCVQVLQR